MQRITVKFKRGTQRDFVHRPRPGGSWTLSLRYEPGFVVIVDEWGKQIAIPAEDILEVIAEPEM